LWGIPSPLSGDDFVMLSGYNQFLFGCQRLVHSIDGLANIGEFLFTKKLLTFSNKA
jgi:hypothetical protein